ncbi:hypothetical protein PVA45_07020 [Entomospira entomophila]|uniref:Mga helix-turn-helix domain-containing protein n=1 Tax=Entomospira entomophila TaxID=2719988 RepID=A0A968KTB5_9SPIO|nr:hypothetical protein [Entomospira entomophilus]NIZ41252.1 hypothetical protein [Entomospira entomophilus]WDI35457.1 hypothetical protein PVA45_07020 [Entomospira entomophilus]
MSYSYQRAIKFLRLLAKESTFKPVHFYAKALNVSSKSIFYYLSQLEHILNKDEFLLHKEPSKGILLEKSSEISLSQIIKENIPQHRQIKILHSLITDQESPSVTDLSEFFHISKTSIISDCKKIFHELSAFTTLNVRFSHQKLYISKNFLGKAQLHLIFIHKITSILPQEYYTPEKFLFQLQDYYPQSCIRQTTSILNAFFQSIAHKCPTHHNRLFFSLIFLIFLYESPKSIILPPITDLAIPTFLDNIFAEILPAGTNSLNNKKFLYMQLLIQQILPINSFNARDDPSFQDLITIFSQVISINFFTNKLLINYLSNTYPIFILQSRLGLSIEHHSYTSLKQKHSLLMNIGLLAITYHHSRWQLSYSTSSACSILAYLLLAIQKYDPIPIYLLTDLDPPMHLLFKHKLKSFLPPTSKLIDIYTIESIPSTSCHLVLSTYPIIPKPKLNFIITSPTLHMEEQEKILQSYVNISQRKMQQQIKHQTRPSLLLRWLQKELIFVKHTFHTKQKIFNLLGSSLLRYNYSSINLTDSIATYDAIQKVDTYLDWVILSVPPHYIIRSAISIYRGKNSIFWHQHNLHNVLLVSLSADDYPMMPLLLKEIYQFLGTPIYEDIMTSMMKPTINIDRNK